MITDIYSKRGNAAPDVFRYDSIPEALRIQIIYSIKDFMNQSPAYNVKIDFYNNVYQILCREYGRKRLLSDFRGTSEEEIFLYLEITHVEHCLDILELCCKQMLNLQKILDIKIETLNSLPPKKNYDWNAGELKVSAKQTIDNINYRFREHGIGFEFVSGNIIRVDDVILHESTIKESLRLLADLSFEGPNAEFDSALQHYKKGQNKESLNDCLKAFESTLKCICKKHKWVHNETDTAKVLLQKCFLNELIPNFMQSHFGALQSTLESGMPTLRNKMSGHGQGAVQVKVPDYIVRYAINSTGAAICLLVNASSEHVQ